MRFHRVKKGNSWFVGKVCSKLFLFNNFQGAKVGAEYQENILIVPPRLVLVTGKSWLVLLNWDSSNRCVCLRQTFQLRSIIWLKSGLGRKFCLFFTFLWWSSEFRQRDFYSGNVSTHIDECFYNTLGARSEYGHVKIFKFFNKMYIVGCCWLIL